MMTMLWLVIPPALFSQERGDTDALLRLAEEKLIASPIYHAEAQEAERLIRAAVADSRDASPSDFVRSYALLLDLHAEFRPNLGAARELLASLPTYSVDDLDRIGGDADPALIALYKIEAHRSWLEGRYEEALEVHHAIWDATAPDLLCGVLYASRLREMGRFRGAPETQSSSCGLTAIQKADGARAGAVTGQEEGSHSSRHGAPSSGSIGALDVLEELDRHDPWRRDLAVLLIYGYRWGGEPLVALDYLNRFADAWSSDPETQQWALGVRARILALDVGQLKRAVLESNQLALDAERSASEWSASGGSDAVSVARSRAALLRSTADWYASQLRIDEDEARRTRQLTRGSVLAVAGFLTLFLFGLRATRPRDRESGVVG